MSMDRISNMLSSIKNASMVKKDFVEVIHSKECENIAKVLEKGGFVAAVKAFKPKETKRKMLRIDLINEEGEAKIRNVKRISKPGKRIYRGVSQLKPVQSGFGLLVVSTSRGVMSGSEAKKKKLGGEVLFEVY
ncbi:30S ribosomal protein S8 [Patescibacteria group bacterium]